MHKKVKSEIEKSTVHTMVQIAQYQTNSVVSRCIVSKISGNITATSFAMGKGLPEKMIPFDTYVQIIDGEAEVIISENSFQMKQGEGIIIPAHAPHRFNPQMRFKMISTIIKSGYEDLV